MVPFLKKINKNNRKCARPSAASQSSMHFTPNQSSYKFIPNFRCRFLMCCESFLALKLWNWDSLRAKKNFFFRYGPNTHKFCFKILNFFSVLFSTNWFFFTQHDNLSENVVSVLRLSGIYSSSIPLRGDNIGTFSWIWGRILGIGTKRPENA